MTTNLSELRSTLERLQAYEAPESLEICTDVVEVVEKENIAERYEKARDDYLNKRVQQVFYEHLSNHNGTFDGQSVPVPDVPSEEEQYDLQQMHQEAQAKLDATAKSVYERHQALQSKHDTFVHRREEIARMIKDMEDSVFDVKQNEDDNASDDDDDDVDEQDLVANEQNCVALAKRRGELTLQLTRKRAEINNKEKKLEQTTSALAEIHKDTDAPMVTADNLEEFEAETQEMQRQVNKYTEISEWYDGMRVVMEELMGITILSVNNADDGKAILLTVQLLGAHQIEIRLKPDLRRQNNLRVQRTKFITSTVVRSPSVDKSKQSPVELHIPGMEDLVRLCSNMGPIEDLKFLLREAMGRIRAIVARVDELSVLRQKYLTKIGMLHHSGHSFGGEDQEIVCSINEGVTVVLRLTPDCPIASGGVYVDQIVGVGGWDQQILEDLKETLNDARHRGPVFLMDALKDELAHLQEEGDISLPTTPCLPKRTKR